MSERGKGRNKERRKKREKGDTSTEYKGMNQTQDLMLVSQVLYLL